MDKIFLEMEILIVGSKIFCSCIIANLSIVSISSSNGKSSDCFNYFLLLGYSHSIHSFDLFLKWKI